MTPNRKSPAQKELPETKPLLAVLAGRKQTPPPWWLMRQAGRYLPEYHKVRGQAASFVEFCLNPDLATEATLQPVRRFGMDAAILFSDIPMVPLGLGQKLWYVDGEGPRLDALRDSAGVQQLRLEPFLERLSPIFETVRRVRAALPRTVALIGFAGSPWTIAAYMVEGGSSKEFIGARRWALADPEGFGRLIDVLVKATVSYLDRQIQSGAEAVQLFDSWAGLLPELQFRRWVIEPTRQIVTELRARHPHVPIIGFPRGAGLLYGDYATETQVDALCLDTSLPLNWAMAHLPAHLPIQGNLDPVALLAGGEALRGAVQRIIELCSTRPHVFNLGHGILPGTPIDHVAELAQLIRAAPATVS
ncbi:MAG: uroporphyrinogen decarboxylase [Proteobacteria bacterium]|nr:uroporphyrinogen decarboxylase [Pseudomonadota bacterium]